MNEKIKEIAEQARAWVNDTNNIAPDIEYVFYKDAYDKKFAELIVEECSRILIHRAETSADYFDDIKVNDHARQVQRDCAQTLRLSFGLETFGEKE